MIESSNRETRDLIEKNRDLIMRNHAAISDTREWVARIAGHLRIAPQPATNDDDAQAA